MIKQSGLTEYTEMVIEEAGHDLAEFVNWVANEWSDGYCQYLCTEADIEVGKHMQHAKDFLNDNATAILADYRKQAAAQ